METLMDAEKSYSFLKRNRIPCSEPKFAKNADSAARTAKKTGFPVALKAVSKKISHKSDSGGVKLNLATEEEVKKAFDDIAKSAIKKAKAKIDGVLIQKMESGTEVIIGLKKDPQFGPVVLFGLGGIYVELMKDVSIRVAPLTKTDCNEMINEIKGSAVLSGARGQNPVNTEAIIKMLMAVSSIGIKNRKIIEMDLNPVMVDEKSAKVVDVRIIAEK